MKDFKPHLETNYGQFEQDVMARIRVPVSVTDFCAILQELSQIAHTEGMEAFVKQESEWFVIRKKSLPQQPTTIPTKTNDRH